jgi:CheY-like chemotaxis protein
MKKLNILVVEDGRSQREMLRDFLRKEGHTVGEAENGERAVQRVREGHYDLLLLDYKMPRSTDAPDIKVIDIITDDPDGPFGAKEASEGSVVSTPPALVDALHDATGVWFKELPVTPEKIIKALKEKGRWPL